MKFTQLLNSQNIKISTIGGILVKFLSALFSFINIVILTRVLSQEDLGIYTISFITVNVLVAFSSLGIPNLLTYYVSRYNAKSEISNFKGIVISSTKYVSIVSGIIFLLCNLVFSLVIDNLELKQTLHVSSLLIPVLTLGAIRSAILRGMRFVILGEIPDTLLRNFLFFIALVYVYYFELIVRTHEIMLFHVTAGTISFLIGILLVRFKLKKVFDSITPTFHIKEWRNKTIPFTVSTNVQIYRTRLFNYLITIFAGLEAVAIFEVAFRGAKLVSFTLGAINAAINPYIAKAFASNDKKSFQRIVTRGNQIAFAFSLPVALVFVFGGERLIELLFGNEYGVAYLSLIILCVGELVNAAAGSAGSVLSMTGNQKYLSKNLIYMLIVSIAIGIPLTVVFDVKGAALAYTFTMILQNIILVSYIRNNLNIKTSLW